MKTAKAVGVVSVLALVSKATGFVREMAIARGFGAGLETDAYRVAQGVPGLFFNVVGAALSTVLVPTIAQLLKQKGESQAFTFVRRMSTMVLLIAGIIVLLLGLLFAPSFVRVMAPGFSDEAFALTVSLTRILIPGLLFTTLAAIATGLHHSLGQFSLPALKHIPANFLIIITAFFFSSSLGIWGLAWATLLGLAFELVVQTPHLYKRGFRFVLDFDFGDPVIKQVGLLMMPVVIGTGLTQMNTLVSRMFASMLPVGSISVLGYANSLAGFVSGSVVTAVTTVTLSKFSHLVAEGRENHLGSAVTQALSSLNALVIPMAAGLLALRVPITRFVYQRGAFSASDTYLTAQALLFASMGLVGTGMQNVSARGFYALKDTRTPMLNGLLGMAINVGLLFLFVGRLELGISGMALAPAFSHTVTGLFLTFLLHKRVEGGLELHLLVSSLWRTVVSSFVMGFLVLKLHPIIEFFVPGSGFISQGVLLGITIGIGGAVYILCLTLLGSQEAKSGWAMVRNMGNGISRRMRRRESGVSG